MHRAKCLWSAHGNQECSNKESQGISFHLNISEIGARLDLNFRISEFRIKEQDQQQIKIFGLTYFCEKMYAFLQGPSEVELELRSFDNSGRTWPTRPVVDQLDFEILVTILVHFPGYPPTSRRMTDLLAKVVAGAMTADVLNWGNVS